MRACGKTFPALRRDLSGLRARLARKPARVLISDPVTGEPQSVSVTENVLLSGLFRPLYAPELASLLPLAITRAADGDFNPLLAQNLEFTQDVADNLSVGMHLSVVCSEDVPRITPADLASAARGFFGRVLVDDFLRACKHWPRAAAAGGLLRAGARVHARAHPVRRHRSGHAAPARRRGRGDAAQREARRWRRTSRTG